MSEIKRRCPFSALIVAVFIIAWPSFNGAAQEPGAKDAPVKDSGSAEAPDKETSDEELAKKLQNPIAFLISVPFQNNYEYRLGPQKKGFRYTMKLQPVIPTRINKDWNLIFRPITPVINQNFVVGRSSQGGLSDIMTEIFFSPNKLGPGGLMWGAGPVLLFPTATNRYLGSGKWGMGPTFVALKQKKGVTAGILAYQLWSFAGQEDRDSVRSTYLQPFVSYTTKRAFTYFCQSESTYNGKSGQWTFPLIGGVSQLFTFMHHKMSLALAGIYYSVAPSDAPKWGTRLTFTLLFPE